VDAARVVPRVRHGHPVRVWCVVVVVVVCVLAFDSVLLDFLGALRAVLLLRSAVVVV
jgi:hypothetical protein